MFYLLLKMGTISIIISPSGEDIMDENLLKKPLSDYKIYIVDDIKIMLKLISSFLPGFDIHTFNHPHDILEAIKKDPPDLILSDVEMPGMTGFELCKKIKEDKKTAHIPVIFLTVLDQNSTLKEALYSGGSELIDKNNMNGETVSLRVKNVLKLQELSQEGMEMAASMRKLLRVISHDLANPLAIAKASSKLLRRKLQDHDDEKVLALVDGVEQGTDRMVAILNDIKDFQVRQEKGESIQLENVSVLKAIEDSIFLVEDRLKKKNIFLDIAPIDENLQAIAHHGILTNQVVGNLLSNSLKFTKEEGNITILVEESGSEITINVGDNGVGIPKELIKDIFDPTKNTSRPGTNNEKGTGFGLPIVKEYVNQMGGEIVVESNDIETDPTDHGTTFSIKLRKAVALI